MAGIRKGTGRGFSNTLTVSLIVHVAVITIGVLLFNSPPKKIFTPVYTVDIVAPVPGSKTPEKVKKQQSATETAPAPKKEEARPVPIEKTEPEAAVKTKKVEPQRPAPVKKEAVRERVIEKPAPEAKQKVSIAKKVEEITKKKEREKEEGLVASSIEEIKKRQEERSREVSREIEDIRKSLASSKKAAPAPRADEKAAPPASNKQAGGAGSSSAGAAATPGTRIGYGGKSGVTSDNLQEKYREYYNLLHDRIHEQWIFPRGFDYEKVSIIVSIRIDRSGNLIKGWLEESSGNRSFDDSLLNATKKAAPFPPLPVDYEENFLEVGLRFCPGCQE